MEQIVIIHPDGKTLPLFSKARVSCVSKATQKVALLSDDLVAISITTATPLDLQIDDYILVYGKRYKLNQLPNITKNGERSYTYEVEMEGAQYDLIDIAYQLPADAYGDTYYSDLAGHLNVLMFNINRVLPGKWILGSVPKDTAYKNIIATEKNCLAALQELCNEYGVEFEITSDGNTNTLNIKSQAGTTHPFTLKYGRGRGLYNLSRENISNTSIKTRLFVYGGTENLGSSYGNNKLCLPGTTRLTSYIEDTEAMAKYGVKEGEKNYSDIKPEREGVITAVGSDILTFSDGSMDFDLNEKKEDGSTIYLIDSTEAKVKFQTGQLAGYEFDVHSYDHSTKTFVINKFTDENGMVFPSQDSEAFRFAKGDKYIITDINLPQSYRDDAEKRLLETGTKDFATLKQPQVSYKLSLDGNFIGSMFGDEVEIELFHVGDFIQIEDVEVNVNKAVRITRIERNLLERHTYDITLSDTVSKSTSVRVINDIKDINDVISINKLADPAKARRRWKATQELLSMVFDPEGDYYSDKIKPLSIETSMLSVGAKSTQFTLRNVTFQPNFNGDANTLHVSAGSLVHYAIEDELRTWTMVGNTFSKLAANTPYYIYAKCPITTGEVGNFVLSAQAKTVTSEPGHYNFLVGVLNSVVTDSDGTRPGRLISLTYGSSTINGRFIRTGRIESSGGGNCYFDLDNDEIGGVIKFVGKDGSIKDVSDIEEKADEAKDFINNTLPGILGEMQGQLDGQIEQFFYEYDPTISNVPAKDWTTTKLKEDHLGDLFYNTKTGKIFRWVKNDSTYSWQELQDSEIAQALALANDALALARTKRRIFTTTPTTPYEVGDLWVQGANGDIMRCKVSRASGSYSASDWEKASQYTSDAALNAFINGNFSDTVTDLTKQIDGKIESWFQSSDPATKWTTIELKKAHVGDMWYIPADKKLFIYISGSIIPFKEKATNNKNFWKKGGMPTTANVPAKDWTTETLKKQHVGDVYYNTLNKSLYVYKATNVDDSIVYNWEEITEEDLILSFLQIVSYLTDGVKLYISNPNTYNVGDVLLYNDNSLLVAKVARQSGVFVLSEWTNQGKNFYYWQRRNDQKAIDAYETASKAQDTADGKRRVFVDTPYPPYDVGDLWLTGGSTDGQLKRCLMARASGSYFANDWVVAVYYDNTKTTIDGGIVTSGTVQLAGDDQSIKAGVTGEGTEDSSVRFWAGASRENRATAPFRVLQDGEFHATKANIKGHIEAESGKFRGTVEAIDGIFYGSLATPPKAIADNTTALTLSFEDGFNYAGTLSQANKGKKIYLPTDKKYNGVHCSIINYGLSSNGYFQIQTVNNYPLLYCGRQNNRNTVNSVILYGTSEVRLKAIEAFGVIRWFVENAMDFSFDYINSYLTNGIPNQISRCLGSYWMDSQWGLRTVSCSDGNTVKLSAYNNSTWTFSFTKSRPSTKNYTVVPRLETKSLPVRILEKSNSGFKIQLYFEYVMGIEGVATIYVDGGGWGFDIFEFDV